MGIDDAGNGGTSLEIDNPRARPPEGLQGNEGAGCNNPPIARRQCGYEAPRLIEGRDFGVLKNQIGVQ